MDNNDFMLLLFQKRVRAMADLFIKKYIDDIYKLNAKYFTLNRDLLRSDIITVITDSLTIKDGKVVIFGNKYRNLYDIIRKIQILLFNGMSELDTFVKDHLNILMANKLF
jgi:hypothetical protein